MKEDLLAARVVGVLLLLLLPGALAGDGPVGIRGGNLIFNSIGSGHAVLALPHDMEITSVQWLGPPQDAFAAILVGQSDFFYGLDRLTESPPLGSGVPRKVTAGTHHAYIFAPAGMSASFELTFDAPGEPVAVAMAPTWGTTVELTGPTSGLAASTPVPLWHSVQSPAALDRATIELPQRGLLVTLHDFFIYGSVGGDAFALKHHVTRGALESDCVLWVGATLNLDPFTIAGLVESWPAFFVKDAGAWELGVDYAAVGTWPTVWYRSLGLSVVLDAADPMESAENPFAPYIHFLGVDPLSPIPDRLRPLAVATSCTSTPALPP